MWAVAEAAGFVVASLLAWVESEVLEVERGTIGVKEAAAIAVEVAAVMGAAGGVEEEVEEVA